MENCIFCKIVDGIIPSCTLYEDDDFKVIPDAFPSGLGHTLIFPKKHVADIFALDEETAAKLFTLATRMAKSVQQALSCDGINILQNNGEAAGQTVFHFHLHIIPRYKGDDVKIAWKHHPQSQTAIAAFLEKFDY